MTQQNTSSEVFKEVDGPLLVTPLDGFCFEVWRDRKLFVINNITGSTTGDPLRGPMEGFGVMFKFDSQNRFILIEQDKGTDTISLADAKVFKDNIEKLWEGKIDSFGISNVPNFELTSICGEINEETGGLQWERADLDLLSTMIEASLTTTKH